MLENELRSLVKIFPEIKFQTELLGFHEALKTQGIIPVVKFIKDNFNQLSQEEVLLHKDSQIIHLSVSQLVSKLILTKDINELLSLFNPESCRIALWEKVNSSILKQNDYLAVSCLDVINGHFDFLKSFLKEKNHSCHKLAEHPEQFRQISCAFVAPKVTLNPSEK